MSDASAGFLRASIAHHGIRSIAVCALFALAILCQAGLQGCANGASTTAHGNASSQTAAELIEHALVDARSQVEAQIERERAKREYVPLYWDIEDAFITWKQGSTNLWGTCGQCDIANTLNLVTDSSFSEADIVDYVSRAKLCDPATGGMTIFNMVDTYRRLLPLDTMDAGYYLDDDALTIDEMASKLEHGIILNVSVYGEMMREGGHTGEGKRDGTHWIVLYGVQRTENGNVAGFDVIDTASDITYLTAAELSDVYYGHDGTVIKDPGCVEVYGWRALG